LIARYSPIDLKIGAFVATGKGNEFEYFVPLIFAPYAEDITKRDMCVAAPIRSGFIAMIGI